MTCLKQTSDGSFIIGGLSNSGVSGNKTEPLRGGPDYWIVKTDATGNKIWEKGVGSIYTDYLIDIEQTKDGGFILGGNSASDIGNDKSENSRGGLDYWIVKLDSAGNKQWDKTFGGSSKEDLKIVKQASDGTYIIGGTSISGISGDKTSGLIGPAGTTDYWIVKLDGNGNKIWDKTLGSSADDNFTSLDTISGGGYLLGGSSTGGVSGDKTSAVYGMNGSSDYWILKIDTNGNKIWDKTIGGDEEDILRSVKQTNDGGFILGGSSASNISGNKTANTKSGGDVDFWVIKLDINGVITWDQTIGGQYADMLYDIRPTSDGGYIAGGISNSDNSFDKSEQSRGGYFDYWVIKLNSSGLKQWDKTVGSQGTEWLSTVQETFDGGYIVGGYTDGRITGDKTVPNFGNNSTSDFWIVKINSGPTGIKTKHNDFQVSISPNPNNGRFHLDLTGIKANSAYVEITDISGKIIFQNTFVIINQKLTNDFILPNLKGMYLIKIRSLDKKYVKKIIFN